MIQLFLQEWPGNKFLGNSKASGNLWPWLHPYYVLGQWAFMDGVVFSWKGKFAPSSSWQWGSGWCDDRQSEAKVESHHHRGMCDSFDIIDNFEKACLEMLHVLAETRRFVTFWWVARLDARGSEFCYNKSHIFSEFVFSWHRSSVWCCRVACEELKFQLANVSRKARLYKLNKVPRLWDKHRLR